MKSTKKTKKAPVKKTSATTKKSVNTQKNPVKDRKKLALNLREYLEIVSNAHINYVDSQVKKQTDSDAVFKRKDQAFSKREDEAYRKYYNHMHKDFTNKEIDRAVLSGKYKDMFMDKALVKDLYKAKEGKYERKSSKKKH